MLEEDCNNEGGFAAIAGRLGCTDRHLRRVFADEYHVTPVEYRQTYRLLLAKSLLTDTALSVTDVAMASGCMDGYRRRTGLRGTCYLSRRLYHRSRYFPGCFDVSETSVWAVLGQQISVKAASTLAGRIAERFGESTDTGIEGLRYIFPAPDRIAALEQTVEERLGPLGITASRARTGGSVRRRRRGNPCAGTAVAPLEGIRCLMSLESGRRIERGLYSTLYFTIGWADRGL